MKPLLVVLLCVGGWAAQEPAVPIQTLLDAGNSSYLKEDYESARQAFAQAWDLVQQRPADDPIRYDILKRLTAVRAAAGEFADADSYLQMAMNWQEHLVGPNDPEIAEDLLLSFNLSRAMKNYDRARLILGRAMAIHVQAYGASSVQVADDFSRMAQTDLEQKGLEDAVRDSNAALQIRTQLAGPLDRSLVPDLDRVAGAYNALREYESAESNYRRALVIRETLEGREDPDLIATLDGLAYACFGQKKYDIAEPLYQRLLALWTKSVGGDHPMVAMALDKVAVFYADQKKYGRAKEAEDQAIAIRTHFLAAGLAAAASEQIAEGNRAEAIALDRRALQAMDPPNPLYEQLKAQIAEAMKQMLPKRKAAPKK
jgi:tetratricopeptide (TPR) repeat protein